MGDKYIVEIEKRREQRWYRIKDFPDDWYFDETYLQKLQKYDPEKEYNRGYARGRVNSKSFEYERGYKKGLADAWKAAKKISFPDIEGGIAEEDMENVFGFAYWVHIMEKFTAAEAIAKIEAYEEKQKAEAEIRVGDEVQISTSGDTCRGVVLRVADKQGTKLVSVIQDDGFGIFNMRDNKIEKTGRHFPEVAELLEKMKEDKEE